MKPAPFEYLVPDSVEAALGFLRDYGDDAKLLAGGQSLVPAMNFRLVQPSVLIDLNRLDNLGYINPAADGGLRIGAMTRQSRLEKDALAEERAPLVFEATPYIAHPQIRNRGTVGGSLAHADPAAELPVISLALGGRFKVASAAEERWVAAEDFFLGMFTADLSPEEMLLEIELPALPAKSGWSFLEVARRQGDYAMMGVAAVLTLDGDAVCQNASLVYLNAGDGPVTARQAAEMLIGEAPSEELCEAAAAKAAEDEIDPPGNLHASPAYQRHLARVLTRRALNQALQRARKARIE